MKKLYSKLLTYTFILLPAIALNSLNVYALANTELKDSVKSRSVIIDTRPDKPAISKSAFKLNFTPFKAPVPKATPSTSAKTIQLDDNKVLSNVKVYPNPVSDQLNLSYHVNKDANVTIKVMDVLGNEISTLLSGKIQAGEKSNTFFLASKLSSGFYFIRLVVGNETIIKRISVL